MNNIERTLFCEMLLKNPIILSFTCNFALYFIHQKEIKENTQTLDDMAFGC